MAGLFAGKRVLVTGSTRGVGRAAAQRFAEEGAEVVVHGRAQKSVAAVVSELSPYHNGRVSGQAADLGSRAAADRLAVRVGKVNILVNCAGIYEELSIDEADEAHFDRIVEVNLTAPWRLARALLGGLKSRHGVVVNVGSDSGLLGYSNGSVYCASKGALIGLTRALATELAPDVRALCVCPGPIDTDMMRRSVESQPDPEATRQHWQSFPLLHRFAKPREIAEAILFAASPNCGFQTGGVILVDGGATAGRRLPR